MDKIETAIIGGGAAGLFLACQLVGHTQVTVFERGERVGRKLSSTGNGQGNLTNLGVKGAEYFSLHGAEGATALISRYDDVCMRRFFADLGVPTIADERGRVYPAARQASALTDALRFALTGADIRLKTQVVDLKKSKDGFLLSCLCEGERREYFAERVVLCVGGKAAKNFGTDGSGYALATGLGHTLTPLYPSLVQLKTDTEHIKTLKGIRVNGGTLTAGSKRVTGDIIFTDYGISGDAVFRLSAFLTGSLSKEAQSLHIDFLPEYTQEQILKLLQAKRSRYPQMPTGELLFGVVNNQIGRAIFRRAEGDILKAAGLVKDFSLTATGCLGFDYAQVTKGGIPMEEVTENLESKLAKGLYFAGEVLDVDGQCGGYNLQWAYASACAVAHAIGKEGGQV